MKIQLHINDADYRDLISNNRRMRGTIGLIGTKEGTFNRHRAESRTNPADYRFRKLSHGRVSVTDSHVRLTLNIDRTETDICASDCIDEESRMASDFIFEEVENN